MRLGALARTQSSLTYADPTAPLLARAFIDLVELLGGRSALVRLYERWRTQWPLSGMSLWSSALHWLGVTLEIEGAPWPSPVDRRERLVVIANHPYGLLDGIAICALVEKLGRPFKILAHSQLMRVPEAMPHFLPIDFNQTEAAVRNNIEARRRAQDALRAGETIVIFPAGGVSTAPLRLPLGRFARADDLPWKKVGRSVAWAELAAIPSAALAIRELRRHVYRLANNT